ncbi:rhodanese-like domain-containing protein [Pedobacter sp. SYP-B3415]|uniref:MBL fold metallo-hydrolase n=1 Tax=Pedobacter sp. SYP-B3415 TaxID=2496641 RepID=UPI00101CC5F6|nr:MBL fold metallo-hydrolase [Pedobacter sp. SYP-B3415]
MKIEQIYTGCLAEAAYYITSGKEAAIIDPLREVDPYLEKARKDGVEIKYIFETHFHADFVSGHVELSDRSGAPIVYGPTAVTGFAAHIAADSEVFRIGDCTIEVLHTPGHTPESTTYLLRDAQGRPHCIFTGDTLFIGDVGRPDLAQQGELTEKDMAGNLYDSLHAKILSLPDDVIVYPAHGAGSACGKNMSKETFDTLGNQKKVNYALRAESREQFIREVTEGILPPPQYFAKNASINKTGYDSLQDVFAKGLQPLNPADFEQRANAVGALVLDTRDPQVFAAGFIPRSINIGLNGQFAPWVGALITDLRQPLLLVTDEGREEETITRLARVGYDNTVGYLEGGFAAWVVAGKQTDAIESVSAEAFAGRSVSEELLALDVRKPGEYDASHLDFTQSRPLDYLNDWMPEIDKRKTYYIHCAGGYRSMIAASILRSRGVENVIDVAGGYAALKNTGLPRVEASCQATGS